jgi:hypothetical protein
LSFLNIKIILFWNAIHEEMDRVWMLRRVRKKKTRSMLAEICFRRLTLDSIEFQVNITNRYWASLVNPVPL